MKILEKTYSVIPKQLDLIKTFKTMAKSEAG